jgi:ubiquinone/menaquinone biosynthesis C-methylase UbiE
MIIPVPQRRFDPNIPEMMDRPEMDRELLRDDLRNLRIINKYFGGYSAIRQTLTPLFRRFPPGHRISILDLGTGSADLPIVIARLTRSLRYPLFLTAVDKNPTMLQVARELTKDFPEIQIIGGNILDLPFADRDFDVVVCSLVLHHFSRSDAIHLIGNMKRMARVALVVHDLRRSWVGAWTAWLYTHLTTRNPLTLYDSYLSVLRAFTPEELAEMATEAGLLEFSITSHPLFRMVMVATV